MSNRADILQSRSCGTAQPGPPPTLWRAFAGFGLWAVCFTVLYTGHALACTWFVPRTGELNELQTMTASVVWLLVAIWVFFLLWLVVLTLRSGAKAWRVGRQPHNSSEGSSPEQTSVDEFRLQNPDSAGWTQVHRRSLSFMVKLTFVVDVSSVVITVISGLPVILTPACL